MYSIHKIIVGILVMLPLVGCASGQTRDQFYAAQLAYMQSLQDKPLVSIKATEGKAIQNLESIVVYMPTGSLKDFKQFSEDHPGWRVADSLIKTAGMVGVIYVGAKAVGDAINNAGQNAGTTINQNITGESTGMIRTSGNMSVGNLGDGNTLAGQMDTFDSNNSTSTATTTTSTQTTTTDTVSTEDNSVSN